MTASNSFSGILKKSEKRILDFSWAHEASPSKNIFEKMLCYKIGGQIRLVQCQIGKQGSQTEHLRSSSDQLKLHFEWY